MESTIPNTTEGSPKLKTVIPETSTAKRAKRSKPDTSDSTIGDEYDKMNIIQLRTMARSRGINYRKQNLKKDGIKASLRDLDLREGTREQSGQASSSMPTNTEDTKRDSIPTQALMSTIPQSRNRTHPSAYVKKDLKALINPKDVPPWTTPLLNPTEQLQFPPPSTTLDSKSTSQKDSGITIWFTNLAHIHSVLPSKERRTLDIRANAYGEHMRQIRMMLGDRYEKEYHQPLRLLVLGQINQAEYTRMTNKIFEDENLKAVHNELVKMILVFAYDGSKEKASSK